MTLNDLEIQNGFLVIFYLFWAVTPILTVNCTEITEYRQLAYK